MREYDPTSAHLKPPFANQGPIVPRCGTGDVCRRSYEGKTVAGRVRPRRAQAELTHSELEVTTTFWESVAVYRARYLALRASEAAEGRSGPTPVRIVRLRPEPALGADDELGYAETVMAGACGG